jgi:hypothetical protein
MPILVPTLRQPASPPRGSRHRVDAARFIERFEALTGLRASSDSACSIPREFLLRPVGPPEELLREYGQELELRTRNALCRCEPGRPNERWTFGRLLEIRGLGVFSLLNLLEVMDRNGVSLKGGGPQDRDVEGPDLAKREQ